jgi:flagellar biosynthetic protein FlhB
VAESNEERSREDLTEEASPYRLEEYRRKGQVAQSRELSGLAALIAAGVAAYAFAPRMGADLLELMREVFRADLSARLNLGSNSVLGATMSKAFGTYVAIGLPVALAGFLLGIFGSFAQIGAIFSADPVTPDLNKIDPIKGFQRLFSMKQLIDGARLVFKMVTLLAVSYAILKSQLLDSPRWMFEEAGRMFGAYGRAAYVMFLSLVGVLVVFGAADLALQRWEYMKNLRMTKQEAKQEFKEREGDPQIKARIRSVQREMARRRMMQAVKKADVVVTNPTHIAVAIVYEKDRMAAPKVVAKGADFLAQKIRKIASDAGVPLVENVPLARTLYKSVKIGQFIPRALYQAVAETLAYVYRLKNRRL